MVSEGPVVGVPDCATTPAADRIAAAVADAGASPRIAAPTALAGGDLTAVVAADDAALRAVAATDPVAPVLPVEVDPGVRSVASADLEPALEHVLGGAATTQHHPVLCVTVDGDELGPAVRDVTLLTAEPARISEFAIASEPVGPVDEVRADGVVVATPAGSRGYAADGEGPLLAPGTGLSVVPVAPFRIDRSRWVVPVADATVTPCRGEAAVTVEIDGAETTTVGRDEAVTIRPVTELRTLVVSESGPTFP